VSAGPTNAADKLEARLRALRATGRKGIVPHLTAGDGGSEVTLAVLRELAERDVPCVALGLPFSDPIADGPELQAAHARALTGGTTFEEVLEILQRFRRGGRGVLGQDLPIVITSYANPLVKRGWSPALNALARAGADALLVADLSIEDAAPMSAAARQAGLAPVFFVAPTTAEARLHSAIQLSRGFVYAIGKLGVTSARTELDAEAQAFLERVRTAAGGLSVAVGFGIAGADDVRAALQHADLALVGSAFVEHLHQAVARASPQRRSDAARVAAREFLQILAGGVPT